MCNVSFIAGAAVGAVVTASVFIYVFLTTPTPSSTETPKRPNGKDADKSMDAKTLAHVDNMNINT